MTRCPQMSGITTITARVRSPGGIEQEHQGDDPLPHAVAQREAVVAGPHVQPDPDGDRGQQPAHIVGIPGRDGLVVDVAFDEPQQLPDGPGGHPDRQAQKVAAGAHLRCSPRSDRERHGRHCGDDREDQVGDQGRPGGVSVDRLHHRDRYSPAQQQPAPHNQHRHPPLVTHLRPSDTSRSDLLPNTETSTRLMIRANSSGLFMRGCGARIADVRLEMIPWTIWWR